MVRSTTPLVERMTLVWHDWFATSNAAVGSQRLMMRQNGLFRRHALGSFADLLLAVTIDPAMLVWLSGVQNTKDAPNENYARELMELFTLGADRPGGYTETDVREQARALTGWCCDFGDTGPFNFRFDPYLHDAGPKTIFGRPGNFGWRDSCRLCLAHPNHASFFVLKLWSYFVPTPPDANTQAGLEAIYTRGRYAVRPVVEAILQHPDLHEGPSMVKPPVVFTAGLLRSLERGVDTAAWVWLDALAGQQLFYPPNVAGWDETRWLDSATFRGRWDAASQALAPTAVDESSFGAPVLEPTRIVDRALLLSGRPPLAADLRTTLLTFAQRVVADAGADWDKKSRYSAMAINAIRMLVAVSPEEQTC
jgi:uncharacterized protein (DUF1800 family)